MIGVFFISFINLPGRVQGQRNAHAFLINSPYPNSEKISAIGAFRGEKLSFDNLSAVTSIDIENMQQILLRRGFRQNQITVLDKEELSIGGVKVAIKNVVPQLDKNALIIFYFTGHGIQVENLDKLDPEIDRLDETLVFKEEIWVDDDINKFYVENLSGFRNIMILDACYTGTSFKLRKTRREWLVQMSKKDFGDDFLKLIEGIPGCASYYSDGQEKRFSMLYFGASGDSQQAKAYLSGSWLTTHLKTIFDKPNLNSNFNYPLLYCAIKSFATSDLGFEPTYVEVGNVTKYNLNEPLKTEYEQN